MVEATGRRTHSTMSTGLVVNVPNWNAGRNGPGSPVQSMRVIWSTLRRPVSARKSSNDEVSNAAAGSAAGDPPSTTHDA